VSKTSLGGLLLALGLVMLWLFTFVVKLSVSLPSGLDFIAILLLGVVPAVVGAAILWAGFRDSSKRRDPESERLASIKDQIVWRSLARDGRITTAEAATHVGRPESEVEVALMSLVSEGRATAEPGEAGAIVYRIESAI